MTKPSMTAKRKLLLFLAVFAASMMVLTLRVLYIQVIRGAELQQLAHEQQTRDRLIAPDRGNILDRNMVGIAKTESVATISVIYNQVKDREAVALALSRELGKDFDEVLERVNRRVALERIAIRVELDVAERIRGLELPGVIIDEDIRRVYPFGSLASHVVGFVGRDNQGIIGLEARYDRYLSGESGRILTDTDVRGREIRGGNEQRIDPTPGYTLVTSIDVVLQQYAEQAIYSAIRRHNALRGAIILMDPFTGEILAMANKPDFDLNEPFRINDTELEAVWQTLPHEQRTDALNQMWRNPSINDTYEPGSTFKIFTSVAGLEEGATTQTSRFSCAGYHTVGGRQIRCWRSPRSHGGLSFVEGVFNSCNPVFMVIAERLGAEVFYDYFTKFGFRERTGIDVPGEAVGIVHRLENVGSVELATMSFGQSFQITSLQLLRGASAVVNGGHLVTPHFATQLLDIDGNVAHVFDHPISEQIISQETSDIMREILEGVVYTGTGNRTYLPGFRVGGKTATSEKLPRRSGRYIASFVAFAPAEDPRVIALVLIDEPQGAYYGGLIAGPVMREVLENALPYLGVAPEFNEEEQELPEVQKVIVPDFADISLTAAMRIARELGLETVVEGQGDTITRQFPRAGDEVNRGTKMILYVST
ncbi:MAG: penicillin-binding transpeptidase domain-containing protein [Defluviitaleaceae bacterium]|nr:penicillin-binding transpeptidase domain-containing protein [Defluviitaleaceae bacterium]